MNYRHRALFPNTADRYSEAPGTVKHLLRDISLISIREVPLYMYIQGRSQLFLIGTAIVMTDKQYIHVNKLGGSGGMLLPEKVLK